MPDFRLILNWVFEFFLFYQKRSVKFFQNNKRLSFFTGWCYECHFFACFKYLVRLYKKCKLATLVKIKVTYKEGPLKTVQFMLSSLFIMRLVELCECFLKWSRSTSLFIMSLVELCECFLKWSRSTSLLCRLENIAQYCSHEKVFVYK